MMSYGGKSPYAGNECVIALLDGVRILSPSTAIAVARDRLLTHPLRTSKRKLVCVRVHARNAATTAMARTFDAAHTTIPVNPATTTGPHLVMRSTVLDNVSISLYQRQRGYSGPPA